MNLFKKCRYGMMIYNNNDIWVGRSLMKYGEFSESEVQVFRDILKPGNAVLDIGANIGCHSIAMSRIIGPTGTIYAYEPERTNFNTLCGNIALNNLTNVYAFQKAMGSIVGHIPVPELDLERTINMGGLSLIEDYSKAQHYTVPLTTLDNENFLRLDFIKMDIEGMEKLALEGGQATIEKFKPVMYIEDDRDNLHDALIELIKSMGYVVYKHLAPLFNPQNYFSDPENVFVSPNGEVLNQIVSGNIFCHHQDLPCPIDPAKFCMTLI